MSSKNIFANRPPSRQVCILALYRSAAHPGAQAPEPNVPSKPDIVASTPNSRIRNLIDRLATRQQGCDLNCSGLLCAWPGFGARSMAHFQNEFEGPGVPATLRYKLCSVSTPLQGYPANLYLPVIPLHHIQQKVTTVHRMTLDPLWPGAWQMFAR